MCRKVLNGSSPGEVEVCNGKATPSFRLQLCKKGALPSQWFRPLNLRCARSLRFARRWRRHFQCWSFGRRCLECVGNQCRTRIPRRGSGAHSYVVTASAPASETALSNEARASDGTQLQTQFDFDENSSTTPQKPRNRRAPDSAGHPHSARDLRGTRFSLAITAILAHCDRSATRTEVSR